MIILSLVVFPKGRSVGYSLEKFGLKLLKMHSLLPVVVKPYYSLCYHGSVHPLPGFPEMPLSHSYNVVYLASLAEPFLKAPLYFHFGWTSGTYV